MLEKEEFKHYTNFIYVTKQHTAKYVIFNEFKSQIDKKQIRYLSRYKGESNTKKQLCNSHIKMKKQINNVK